MFTCMQWCRVLEEENLSFNVLMHQYITMLKLYDVECMNTEEFTQSFKKIRQESLVRIESTKDHYSIRYRKICI